jgi:hypothetical protein
MTIVAIPPRVPPASAPEGLGRSHRRRLLPEQIIATVALLGLYLWTGWWLRNRVGFAIGDSIARSADAVYVIASRDPHLAAIGFYWPPLSSFIQLPLVPILVGSGHADMAGPISTALCMAATVFVLMQICRYLRLGRLLSLLVGMLFGLNPVMVFYAANGMSEACCFLFLAIGMWGFIRYVDSRRPTDMALMATGLALAAMTRVEVIFVAVVVAVVATVEWRGLPRSLPHSVTRAAIAALPPVYLFLLWMAVQGVLLRDPLFFVHTAGKVAFHGYNLANGPGASQFLLPQAHDKLAVLGWLVEQYWFFGPPLFLGAVYAVLRPREARVPLGLLAAAATFEAVQVPYRLKGTAFNDPRYFTPLAVLGAIMAAWLLSRIRVPVPRDVPLARSPVVRTAGTVVVIAALAAGGAAGTVAEANPRRAAVVHEDIFFARVLGRPRANLYGDEWQGWRRVAVEVDHLLAAPGTRHRVICNAESCNPVVVFSTRPNDFIVDPNRDFQSIMADPTDRFDVAITIGNGDPIAAVLTPVEAWKVVESVKLSPLSNSETVDVWVHSSAATSGASP